MAEIDIDRNPVPGEPFIEVYPISTRLLTTGLWMSWSIGDDKVWPVEDDPDMGDAFGQRQVWCYYAAKHDELGEFETHVGPGIYYDDGSRDDRGWDAIELFSEAPDEFMDQYLYSPAWMHFDLTGINAASIQRAEFICNIGGQSESANDDLRFLVQMRNGITDYEGWRPSPFDFRTMSGASVCPEITAEEIFNNAIANDHQYADPYLPPEWMPYGPRHVLPINEAGMAQLRRGGRQGVMVGLDGTSPPTGYNRTFMECEYSAWDEGIAAGQPKILAGVLLPHLRLWLGGGEAEMTLGLRIDARPSVDEPRRILSHAARRRRGW